MPRHWLIPLLVVGLVAAVVLYVTADSGSGAAQTTGGASDPVPARPTLADGEVRAYIAIWPRLKDLGAQIAPEVAKAAAEGRTFDGQAARERLRAKRNALMKAHHLSPADWDDLRRRVEHVVAAIRWENERPEREQGLAEAIAEKEAMLPGAEKTHRKQIEFEIERLRAQLDAPGPELAEADLNLIRSYWAQLDPMVLRSPAPMPAGGVSRSR
jgi:hypothetical protein